jgi:hypothetical protein
MALFNTFFFLFLLIVIHALYLRAVPSANRVKSFIALGVPMGVILISVCTANYGFFSITAWAPIFLFAFLCELYLFLFTFALASISANLLSTMYSKPMSFQDIELLYDERQMVLKRFNRLISSGLIVLISVGHEGEGYEVTPKGKNLLKWLDYLRNAFKH